jgi:glycosyltransferase involved in cell wall biosynthesis
MQANRAGVRVLTLLEALSVTGSAKAVLEFARETARPDTSGPAVELCVVMFARGARQIENSLTAILRDTGIPFEFVFEDHAFDRQVIPQLRALVRKHRPDVIWSNAVKSHFLVRWAGLHRSAGWVAFHHGYTTTNAKMRLYNQLDRWSLPAADRVLTVCAPFAKQLERVGVAAERIRVQHMPIRPFHPVPEEQARQLRRQIGIADGAQVLLNVGRLSHEKGHIDLLRALALLRARNPSASVRLVLAGDGPERPRIEKLRRELALADTVILAGHQEDIRGFYAIADIFVLPSHSEGSPNVLLEAMASGVPVVAAAVGGVPELATDGETALLVQRRDIGGLAAAMERLLADVPLRERLARCARGVLARNTPQAYARSIRTVLEETIRPESQSEPRFVP